VSWHRCANWGEEGDAGLVGESAVVPQAVEIAECLGDTAGPPLGDNVGAVVANGLCAAAVGCQIKKFDGAGEPECGEVRPPNRSMTCATWKASPGRV